MTTIIVPRESSTPVVVPLLAGAAALGGAWYLRQRATERPARGRDAAGALTAATTTDIPPPPGRWVFPVGRWQGRGPVVSDGWGSPRQGDIRGGTTHRGVDIMFRRRSLSELTEVFPPRAPHSRWHFMPPGTLVLAASDGEVWSAGWTPRGYTVVLSHGAPWATYYTHLQSLRVGESKRGSSKERVRTGQPLGVVGADPKDTNGIAHLHFEMWFGGAGDRAIDPSPFLRLFEVIDAPPSTPSPLS